VGTVSGVSLHTVLTVTVYIMQQYTKQVTLLQVHSQTLFTLYTCMQMLLLLNRLFSQLHIILRA